MKKKYILFITLLVITIITVFLIRNVNGRKPFKDIHIDDVKSVTLTLRPPNDTYELSKKEIEELINILNSVEIYNKDNSYGDFNGQTVTFFILKNDGSTIDVMAYNPFFIINGTGYKTEYEACEKLNALGNKIIKLKF